MQAGASDRSTNKNFVSRWLAAYAGPTELPIRKRIPKLEFENERLKCPLRSATAGTWRSLCVGVGGWQHRLRRAEAVSWIALVRPHKTYVQRTRKRWEKAVSHFERGKFNQ